MPGHYKHYFTFREFPKKVSFLCFLFVHFYREIFLKVSFCFSQITLCGCHQSLLLKMKFQRAMEDKKKKKSLSTFYHWPCKVRIGCLPSITLFSTSANLASVFFPPSTRVKISQPAKGIAETHSNTEPDIGIL